MSASSPSTDLDTLLARVGELVAAAHGRRVLLGITGAPGSGKTTLAQALVAAIDGAAMVPMDGFHLANASLERLGRAGRKGALDTFDGWGFVALVRRLRDEVDHDVFVPSFRREVDEPIAGELVVPAGASVVVVEGNYLLVDEVPWASLAGLLDEVWFCEAGDDERLARLIDRHVRGGRTLEAATAWARDVDGTNAALIAQTRDRAARVVSTGGSSGAAAQ